MKPKCPKCGVEADRILDGTQWAPPWPSQGHLTVHRVDSEKCLKNQLAALQAKNDGLLETLEFYGRQRPAKVSAIAGFLRVHWEHLPSTELREMMELVNDDGDRARDAIAAIACEAERTA